MPKATKGALIECDPSIKALIIEIDYQRHDIIIEELDDTHLLVDSDKVEFLKKELDTLLNKNTYNPTDADN
ncbi:general transcription and DNA repair factor IIH subunit Tfb5p [Trichomonascus vanleenenianus]|uniref:TFIIH complex subunit TFB5 n=1 Tax=Trichomonascus vanleenenianus TaxID=2268995 RepID=UPI003EC9600D